MSFKVQYIDKRLCCIGFIGSQYMVNEARKYILV